MINSFKRARIIAGLTQRELADRLRVSAVTVHKWETGEAFPRPKRLKQISYELQIPVDDLLEEMRAV